MMSRISNLLAQILSAVYGRDVRQSIHDAIKACYEDVTNAKTIADESADAANEMVANAESRVSSAISTMETSTNAAIANCNSATTNANQAAIDIWKAFDDLGLAYVDGRLCVRVERSN